MSTCGEDDYRRRPRESWIKWIKYDYCFPRCVKCRAHIGGEGEPACYKCDECNSGPFCGDCCDTTTYDEDCAPDDEGRDTCTFMGCCADCKKPKAAPKKKAATKKKAAPKKKAAAKKKGSGAEAVVALASKPYSELQAMAKARGIRANTKKEVLVKALNEATGEQ
jgi:hypothetical protein